MKTTRLIEASTYMEMNNLYLKLVYEVEDDETIRHIIFPKVVLPISTNDIRVDCDVSSNLLTRSDFTKSYIVMLGGYRLPIEKGTVLEPDMNGQRQFIQDVEEVEITVEEKSHNSQKMTIAEIEKILGHKVEIVNEED